LTLVHPDGTDPRYLTAGSDKDDLFSIFKISPDVKQVAYVEVKTENKERTCKLFVIDTEGKDRRALPVGFEPGVTASVDWSPDGKGLVLNMINNRSKQSEIGLVDVDGKNFRKLGLPPGSWNIQVCGWQKLPPGLRARNLEQISEDEARTPRGRFRMLLQEIKQAKPFEPHRYAERFLAIADSAPDDRVAVDALHWIVTFTDVGPQFDRAVDQLAERHATNMMVGQEAGGLAYKTSLAAERLLRAVIAGNPHRHIEARASLALGRFLKNQSELVRRLKDVPEEAEAMELRFIENGSNREHYTQFLLREPDALIKQAEAVLEQTIAKFGDEPGEPNRTVGQSARCELYEIRSLCAGRPAPGIEGRDTGGMPLKLNDYRGKVVLLNFWTDSCGGCVVLHPYERALAERMRGRPFVLLGVNVDDDVEKVRQQMKAQNLTWRSWWDSRGDENTSGPIAEQFNVRVWPTLYLLDHHGIIRHKFLGTPGTERLDAAIDTLVKDAESTASDLPKG
jgi:thiol-disulfide isomerase/thioredoxin